jgi:hypothetical protein
MKILLAIAGLLMSLLTLTACSDKPKDMPNQSHSNIESEVRQAFLGLVEASNALDVERYFSYFDKEKFTGLNADGTVWSSMKDFEMLVIPGFASVKRIASLEFSKVIITEINQTTAVLVNEYKQRIELKNGEIVDDAGGGTQIWSKSSGAWKLVSVSASEKPKLIK